MTGVRVDEEIAWRLSHRSAFRRSDVFGGSGCQKDVNLGLLLACSIEEGIEQNGRDRGRDDAIARAPQHALRRRGDNESELGQEAER
jgi:hypothetical protein